MALRPTIDQVAELDLLAREAGRGVEARLAMSPEPAERGPFELALLMAPYFLGNVPVREATTAVGASGPPPDGALYFQAHRRRGGETYVGYARELFEDVELLGLGGGNAASTGRHGCPLRERPRRTTEAW